MGYEKYLKTTKEAVDKLRTNATRSKENLSDESRLELCMYCMLDHSGESTHTVITDIERNLRYISYAIRSEVYRDTADRCEKEGELVFCGWEYSRCEPDLEVSEHMPMVLKTLTMLAIVVKTPDYFKDREMYYEKLNDVTSEIDAFCDTCTTCTDFEIIAELAKMGIVDNDDDDGDTLDNGGGSDVTVDDIDYVNGARNCMCGSYDTNGYCCGDGVSVSGYCGNDFVTTMPDVSVPNTETTQE